MWTKRASTCLLALLVFFIATAAELNAASCKLSTRGAALGWDQTSSGTVSGEKCAFYRFTLPQTTAIETSVTSDYFPPTIIVLDTQGNEVVDRDNGWPGPDWVKRTTTTLRVTLPAGSYYLAVQSGSITPGLICDAKYFGQDPNKCFRQPAVQSFEIRLRDLHLAVAQNAGGKCPDYSVIETAHAAPLSLDAAAATGELDVTDCFAYGKYHEFYRVTVPTARTVSFKASSSAFEPDIALFSVSGAKFNRALESDTLIVAQVPAGDYVIAVAPGIMSGGFATGRFQLSAKTLVLAGESGKPCQQSDVKSLSFGTTAGRMHAGTCLYQEGDVVAPAELYKFTIAKASNVVIQVNPVGFRATLALGGGPQPQLSEGAGPRTISTTLEPGDYYVLVVSQDGNSGTFNLSLK